MALHAEQLARTDELPKFAWTSLSAHFISSYFLLNAGRRPTSPNVPFKAAWHRSTVLPEFIVADTKTNSHRLK